MVGMNEVGVITFLDTSQKWMLLAEIELIPTDMGDFEVTGRKAHHIASLPELSRGTPQRSETCWRRARQAPGFEAG